MNIFAKLCALVLFTLCPLFVTASTLKEQAEAKITRLNSLIAEVEDLGIDTRKENLTVRTAEIFLNFADWDEANVAINEPLFAMVSIYKDNASEMANGLADFERNDIITMLDEAISYAQLLKAGSVVRTPSQSIDWAQVTTEDDQLTFNGRPVFLEDYTWKPNIDQLNDYHGHKKDGGFFLTPSYVKNEVGELNSSISDKLDTQKDGHPWFIFIANNNMPDWAKNKYGDALTAYKGEPFLAYDIDHPGARDVMGKLLDGTVSKMAGKNYTQLGYMLCNEPRWITYKNGTKKVWYNGGVSAYTMTKFKAWLEEKHHTISSLNAVWGTSFTSFSNLSLDVPIDLSLMGSPQWYDWNTFNDYRVVEWFKFMKGRLLENDPNAKAHLKIMPSFFTDNDPATGIDLEALTELSEINGNDCAAHYNYIKSGEAEWEAKYVMGWRELYMGYDFLKSVKPNQLNFNTESHILTTNSTRDLYMNPKFVRAAYWSAHQLGMSASQTWYWPRKEDGSLRSNLTNSYAGSCNQQPRVTNELHATLIDLNTFSEEIMAIQRQRKPLRLFYSKTSAHQNAAYMDGIFEMYEALNFEGLSLGFATKNIIAKQDNNDWDAILIYKTAWVTQAERDTLQAYLDNGGTIVIDNSSLKMNEYWVTLSPLNESNGQLLLASSLADMKTKALGVAEAKLAMPEITIAETNSAGFKACLWRCVKNEDGKNILSVTNFGKVEATLDISFRNSMDQPICKDLIDGVEVSSQPTLQPYEVFFVEVTDANDDTASSSENSVNLSGSQVSVYPTLTTGEFVIDLSVMNDNVQMRVFSMDGKMVLEHHYSQQKLIVTDIYDAPNGIYFVQVYTGKVTETFRLVKG